MARNSIILFITVGLLVLPAEPITAEQIAELDLDGIFGNGPDTISVQLGAGVEVDVWLAGGDPLSGFQIVVCNADGSLQFESVEYDTRPGWSDYPPAYPSPYCVSITAVDPATIPLPQPDMVATMTYTAVMEHPLAELTVNKDSSSVLYSDLMPGQIDVAVDAFIQIGATGTEIFTWGSIKGLFR